MNTREKLIELLSKVQYLGGLEEKIADHLIANGITFATGNNFARQLIPMGAITYAVACSHCKNRGADAKKCDQCRCEVKSWFEFDPATVQQWISVKDRLPEKYGWYLIVENGEVTVARREPFLGLKEIWNNDTTGGYSIIRDKDVTHWMPLPQPPKGE